MFKNPESLLPSSMSRILHLSYLHVEKRKKNKNPFRSAPLTLCSSLVALLFRSLQSKTRAVEKANLLYLNTPQWALAVDERQGSLFL